MSNSDKSTIFRETKFGQKGYIKEDVLSYVDELQQQIENLKNEISQKDDTIKRLTLKIKKLENDK